MKLIKSLFALLLVALAMPSFADNFNYYNPAPVTNGFYAGIHGGGTIPSNFFSLDSGYDVGANLGYHFGPWHLEGAFTYYNNNISDPIFNGSLGNLELFTAMANGYYEFFQNYHLRPYIGAGIGWLHAIANGNAFGVKSTAIRNEFAYQGIAGLAYYFNSSISLGVEYHILSWTNNDNSFYNVVNAVLKYNFS